MKNRSMTKPKVESSARGKQRPMKGELMKREGDAVPLSPAEQTELAALAELPDNAINTSDAPELDDWSNARRGLFYRPTKQQLTLRLDADLIAWFRQHATSREKYQTRINQVLRDYVTRQEREAR
jgi:uncharacterized protein (DUF4415 family)